MPGDSYWPFALTVALMIVFYGLLTRSWWLFGIATAVTFACCVAWLWPQHLADRPRPSTTEDPEMEVPVGDPTPSSTGGWGMSLLIVNEAMFFAYLIFSYFYLSTRAQHAFPPDGPPDLKLVIPNTFILLGSSISAWWASRGLDRNNQGRLRAGLIITIILGIVFLGIQAIEYSAKSSGPDASAYASSFFTTTGFHGVHVLVGLLMLGVILVRAFRGHFTSRDHLAVSNVVLYWHFVDAVWLVVFSSLYLVPRMM
jgi:heme/copper-type cytochrome/quinol oxidase subunit 3